MNLLPIRAQELSRTSDPGSMAEMRAPLVERYEVG